MTVNRKDLAAGAIFIAFGAFYGITALRKLPIGEALNMGPGYFPVALSAFVVLIGAIIAVRSFIFTDETPFGIVPWRGIVMLSLATIVFAALLTQLGMLPCIFLTALVACMASSQIKLTTALVISAGVAIFCTVIFGFGIKLPVPILGSWFGE